MSSHEAIPPQSIFHLPRKILENLPFWTGAALVALISAIYMKLFSFSEEWAQEHVRSFYIFILPPLGLVVSMSLAYFFSKESAGTGIPQSIAAVEISMDTKNLSYLDRLIGLRVIFIKILGSCLCSLCGGSTGREGPTLHISTSLFYLVNKYWPKKLTQPSLQSMVIAGGAAGLAAAFNTPLGGIVFAVEELSKTHISKIRTAVFQAVIIAGVISQAILGNYLYFGKVELPAGNTASFLETILLAVFVGLIAGLFSKAILAVSKWTMDKLYWQRLLFALFCGVGLSFVIYLAGPAAMGSGKNVILDIINDKVTPSFTLALSRIFSNLLTFSSGVVGGVFAPSLASGAAIGQLASSLFGIANVHLMVMVGMVAFLTGVCRAPFTTFVLVMEMSNSHDFIIYLILASLVANAASRIVLNKSFYEQMSEIFITKAAA